MKISDSLTEKLDGFRVHTLAVVEIQQFSSFLLNTSQTSTSGSAKKRGFAEFSKECSPSLAEAVPQPPRLRTSSRFCKEDQS